MELITNEQYRKLSSNSKILYSLFLNKRKFSKMNLRKFSDENGVFIYFSNSQIQKHLHCSVHTAINTMKELQLAGLIRKEYQQNGMPVKIYVNDIRDGNKSTFSFSEKEKEESFDVEKAREMELKSLYNFAEKKKRRKH